MSVWFEGQSELRCDIGKVKASLSDLGRHYVGVIGLMPGLSSVELVEQGPDFVTLKTNEGLMKRTGIATRVEDDAVTVEFDEEYQAGSPVTARSHFVDEFKASDHGVVHRTVVSDVEAPGLLGFLYRKFGSKRMGAAFLKSYQQYFERV